MLSSADDTLGSMDKGDLDQDSAADTEIASHTLVRVAPISDTTSKSLRLSRGADKGLRLLAAQTGMSQQALIEIAVLTYLEQALEAGRENKD